MSEDIPSVTVEVGDETATLDELVDRFDRGEELRQCEIAALVEYPATGVDVAEWCRLKAKVMFGSNPHLEGDSAAEQAATEWLREIFQEHEVETVADYHDLLKEVGEDHTVQEAVKKLTENATPFERQRGPPLMQHLDQQSEKPVEELYKPRDAGDDWDPAIDQTLHEFIALVEGGSDDGFYDDMESWQELKEAANFDPEEWDYENE